MPFIKLFCCDLEPSLKPLKFTLQDAVVTEMERERVAQHWRAEKQAWSMEYRQLAAQPL